MDSCLRRNDRGEARSKITKRVRPIIEKPRREAWPFLAPRLGFEPRYPAPEAGVLPLDDLGKTKEAHSFEQNHSCLFSPSSRRGFVIPPFYSRKAGGREAGARGSDTDGSDEGGRFLFSRGRAPDPSARGSIPSRKRSRISP